MYTPKPTILSMIVKEPKKFVSKFLKWSVNNKTLFILVIILDTPDKDI